MEYVCVWFGIAKFQATCWSVDAIMMHRDVCDLVFDFRLEGKNGGVRGIERSRSDDHVPQDEEEGRGRGRLHLLVGGGGGAGDNPVNNKSNLATETEYSVLQHFQPIAKFTNYRPLKI